MVKRISPKKTFMNADRFFKKYTNKTSGFYVDKRDVYKISKGKSVKVKKIK